MPPNALEATPGKPAEGFIQRTIVRLLTSVDKGLWAALCLSLPALMPLLQPGVGDMADAVLHIYRTVELSSLWQDGFIYSRWAPDMAFGLGYPLFNFYAPLLYYISASLHLMGLNFELAMKLTLAMIMLLSCAGTYALARQWVGQAGAMIAAVAYVWTPFRLREIYFQGDFAQLLALSIPPVMLWALHRLAMTGKQRYFVVSAAAFAGLFLSHSISTMIFTPVILAYIALLLILKVEARQRVGLLILALMVGAGLSTFFWFPALYEKQLVGLDSLRSGDFDFRQHFAPPLDLISPSIPLDISAANPYQPFNLGIAHLILALPSLWALRTRRLRWIVAAGWLGLAACVFMFLSISTPVWQAISLLAFTEFPWRWLGVAALPLALLTGITADWIPRWRAAYATLACLAIIVTTSPHLYPRAPFTDFGGSTIADMVRYELKTQAIGTTSAGEYLPKDISERPMTSPLVHDYLEGRPIDKLNRADLPAQATATLLEHRALTDRWHLNLPTATEVKIYTLYYPGWIACVDGQSVPILPPGPDGHITVSVPAGEHELALRFEDTRERQLANLASIATLLFLIGMMVIRRRSPSRSDQLRSGSVLVDQPESAGTGLSTREAAIIIGLALAITIGKVAYIDPHTDWFRAASDLDQIPGIQYPVNLEFEGKVRLLGYSIARSEVSLDEGIGESINVTLYWRALQPMDQQYACFVHLMSGEDRVAQKDNVHPGGIPSTSWRTDQYVRDEHRLIIQPETRPGACRLQVGLYNPKDGHRLNITGTDADFYSPPSGLVISGPIPESATTCSYSLGSSIHLVAYEIENPTVRPSEEVVFHLYWQATSRIERDYTVFIHLYDSEGKRIGVGDRQPVAGQYPTSIWMEGDLIKDLQTVRVDPDAPPGTYQLSIGLYDLETMQRLEAKKGLGSRWPDDAIVLEPPIQVVAP